MRAEEVNRYDLLSRMLTPFVSVFAKAPTTPNRAVSFTVKLEKMTDLPDGLVGSQAEVAVEYPDKLRLHGPVLGEDVTICRRGPDLWAYPGSKVEAMLKTAAAEKKLPRIEGKPQLQPFSLPLPDQDFVLLPALFQVKDVGSEPLDGEPCRVMDLFVMPQLARSAQSAGLGCASVGAGRRQTRAHFRGQARLDGGRTVRPRGVCPKAPRQHLGTDHRAGGGCAEAGSRAVSAVARDAGAVGEAEWWSRGVLE